MADADPRRRQIRIRAAAASLPQARLWTSRAEYVLFLGGVRSGKTKGGAMWAHMRPPNTTWVIGAPTYRTLLGGALANLLPFASGAAFRTIKREIQDQEIYDRDGNEVCEAVEREARQRYGREVPSLIAAYNKSDGVLRYRDGKTFHLRTAERAESAAAVSANGFWFDEAGLVKTRAFFDALCARVSERPSQSILTTTPGTAGGRHWLHEAFVDNGIPGVHEVIKSRTWDNRFLELSAARVTEAGMAATPAQVGPARAVLETLRRSHPQDLTEHQLADATGRDFEVRNDLKALVAAGLAEWTAHGYEAKRRRDWKELQARLWLDAEFLDIAAVEVYDVTLLTTVVLPAVKLVTARAWDTAATAGAGDYTCGTLMSQGPDKMLYIRDAVRGQWDVAKRDKMIVDTAAADDAREKKLEPPGKHVLIWVPKERGGSGKGMSAYLVADLSGYAVKSWPESGTKEDRAQPLASQIGAGNVKMTAEPGCWENYWHDGRRLRPAAAREHFKNQLEMFPGIRSKDCSDSGAMALQRIREATLLPLVL